MAAENLRAEAPVSDPLEAQQSREPTSIEKDRVQEFTRQVGADMFYKVFKVDLELLAFSWQRRLERFRRFESGTAGVKAHTSQPTTLETQSGPTGKAVPYGISLEIDQTDDIRRMESDPWDIPFAVKLKARSRLLQDLPELSTEVYVPLSYKDELWIRTSVPIPFLGDEKDPDGAWRAFSTYSNHLGVNTLESGFGRRWFGNLNFRYGYRVQFIEDPNATSENRHRWTLETVF